MLLFWIVVGIIASMLLTGLVSALVGRRGTHGAAGVELAREYHLPTG